MLLSVSKIRSWPRPAQRSARGSRSACCSASRSKSSIGINSSFNAAAGVPQLVGTHQFEVVPESDGSEIPTGSDATATHPKSATFYTGFAVIIFSHLQRLTVRTGVRKLQASRHCKKHAAPPVCAAARKVDAIENQGERKAREPRAS